MKKHLIILTLAALAFASCDDDRTSADKVQSEQTAVLMEEAQRQVGMPGIVNFTERKFAKMILELRDQEISTYTYIVDMHGKLHFLCESIGYGLPYSVQFTNPETLVRPRSSGASYTTMPQPDPNGLFMPDGLSATWVLAVGDEGEVKPMYVEPEILVSPIKLHDALTESVR